MWDDEDDEDFDPEEAQRQLEEERKRVENLPITKKADEIFNLVNALTESIRSFQLPEDVEDRDIRQTMLEQEAGFMFEDAIIIRAKVRGAEGGGLYTLRMEKATLIKIHARNLLTQTTALRMEGYPNKDYLKLL